MDMAQRDAPNGSTGARRRSPGAVESSERSQFQHVASSISGMRRATSVVGGSKCHVSGSYPRMRTGFARVPPSEQNIRRRGFELYQRRMEHQCTAAEDWRHAAQLCEAVPLAGVEETDTEFRICAAAPPASRTPSVCM